MDLIAKRKTQTILSDWKVIYLLEWNNLMGRKGKNYTPVTGKLNYDSEQP